MFFLVFIIARHGWSVLGIVAGHFLSTTGGAHLLQELAGHRSGFLVVGVAVATFRFRMFGTFRRFCFIPFGRLWYVPH